MNTTDLVANLRYLPLYRVRLTGRSIDGSIVHEHGRRLATALIDANDCHTIGGYGVTIESYNRISGETIRILRTLG